YKNYKMFRRFTNEKITWVTRKTESAVFSIQESLPINPSQQHKGVTKDQIGILGHNHRTHTTVKARLIHFTDPTTGKEFQFLTNNTKLAAATIALIYKKRWQIEMLFKRIKQNYPLKNFLGDSENAIKIQIWCALIADLLIKLIKAMAGKKWSFSNLSSVIRIHLMTYIDLFAFLKNPEKALRQRVIEATPMWTLFPT